EEKSALPEDLPAQPETQVGVPVIAVCLVAHWTGHAVAHRHHLGAVRPRAAAQDLLRGLPGTSRPVRGGVSVIVAVIPVGGPLPHATVHGIQPVAVGREALRGENREGVEAAEIAVIGTRW